MAKSFDVSYRFLAIDAFTAVGDKVSTSIENIKRSIVDIKKATENSESSFRKMANSIGNFGSKLKSFGTTVSTHVSIPMLAAGLNMLRLAGIQEQAEAKLTQGLENYLGTAKFTFESLTKMASDLQSKSLFGDEDIIAKSIVPLLRIKSLGEEEFKRAQQSIVDIAASTGRDLSKIAITVGKALNEPVEGLTLLESFGLDFNMPGLKETLKFLVESGQTLVAQQAFLTIIERQVGGVAEAISKTASGRIKQLWNTIGDINEDIGKELGKILSPLIAKMKDLADSFSGLSSGQKRFLAWAIAIGAVIGPVLIAIGTLAFVVKGLALAFGILSLALSPILLPLLLIVGGVTAGFFAFKLAAKFLKENFPNALTVAGEKIDWLKGKFVDFKNVIVDFFSFGNIGGKFVSGLTSVFGSIGEFGLEKSQSFDELFSGGKAQEQAAHAFETKFNFAAIERDSADININLKSPENVIESVSAKSSGRMSPKIGMQMIDG